MISTIFIIVQASVLALLMLIHFLIGLKRGFKKTLWYFLGNTLIVLFIFVLIGLIPTYLFISEENAQKIMLYFMSEQSNEINVIFKSGGYEIVIALADFLIKIVLFILFYVFLRWLLMATITKKTWFKYKIKKVYPTEAKQRYLGGFFGLIRGFLAGLTMMLPILVLVNAFDNEKLRKNKDAFDPIIGDIIEANKYNFIKPFNFIKINHIGLADHFFDLAFSTKIKGNNVRWRAEISFYSEAAMTYYDIDQSEQSFELTSESLKELKPLFIKMSQTRLMNLAIYPGYNYALTELSNEKIEDTTQQKIAKKLKNINIDLNKDAMSVYALLEEMLSINDINTWQTYIQEPTKVLELNAVEREKVLDILEKMTDLKILKLGDVAIETFLSMKEGQKIFSWRKTDEEKEQAIQSFIAKISNFENEFTRTLSKDMIKILKESYLTFPSDVKLDDKIITLQELLEKPTNMLNIESKTYKNWFNHTIKTLGELKSLDGLLDPGVDYMVSSLIKDIKMQNTNEVILNVKKDLSSTTDLNRELNWLIETYSYIKTFYNDKEETNDVLAIIDKMLTTEKGKNDFNQLIQLLSEGKTISNLSKGISGPLIKESFSDGTEMSKIISHTTSIKNFDLIYELKELSPVLIDLYKEKDFSLKNSIQDSEQSQKMLDKIFSNFIETQNKETILNSNIVYAVIDQSIKNIRELEVPNFVKDSTGNYPDFIDKKEIQTILGIIEQMNFDIITLINDPDSAKLFTEKVMAYAQTEKGMATILDSGILYNKVSQLIKENKDMVTPKDALDMISSSPYYGLVKKEEIFKLLKVVKILGINDFTELNAELIKNELTNDKLTDIINLESAFVNVEITSKIKKIDSIIIPQSSYTSQTKEQIKASELVHIIKMLDQFNLKLNDLATKNDFNKLLTDIKVKEFVKIPYKTSSIIRGFITSSINHISNLKVPGAYDSEGVLTANEIAELFKVLNRLDNGNDSLLDLKNRIDINTMTIKRARNILNYSQSAFILGLVSNEILKIDQINVNKLPSTLFIDKEKTVLTKKEVESLFNILITLDNTEETLIKDAVKTVKIDTLTLGQTKDILNSNSELMRYLISDQLTGGSNQLLLNSSQTVLSKKELIEFIDDLIGKHGITYKFNELNKYYENITITELESMLLYESILTKSIASAQIDKQLGSSERTKNRYLTNELLDTNNRYITASEARKLINALYIIADVEKQKVKSLLDSINTLDLEKLTEVLKLNSEIIKRKVSDELIIQVKETSIDFRTLDNLGYIENDQLVNTVEKFSYLFGKQTNVSQVNQLMNQLKISKIKNIVIDSSSLIYGMISSYVQKNLDKQIRQRAYDNTYTHKGKYLNKIIKIDEVINLFSTIENLFGDISLNEISSKFNASELKINQIINLKDSYHKILIKALLSDNIKKAINQTKNPIDKRSYEQTTYQDEKQDLSYEEFNKLISVLKILDGNQNMSLKNAIRNLENSNLNMNNIRKMIEEDSYIVRSHLTTSIKEINQNLGNIDIYDDKSFDFNEKSIQLIKKEELIKFIDALNEIGNNNQKFSEALKLDILNIPIEKIKKAVQKDSLIFQRIITIILDKTGIYSEPANLIIPKSDIINFLNTMLPYGNTIYEYIMKNNR
ncbi:conserved hypothetical protein [Alteracholeplasma palmae J233]|uniref:Uncharacterized protein n=1 Tax=Alteracholeplasma palmae (strain ATCC 49389 / J233) TaxID=1318466 RepID=U4KKT1_ALTPJ|nr:CvpA family protein [Alteracholeplasma palmae]CCV64404.1 conserved hypothetical protein [Alteracholeplasma palmae J233]